MFSYLCDDDIVEVISFLSDKIKKSKHKGCIEFGGKLIAISKKGYKLYVYDGDRDSAEFLNVYGDDKIIMSSDGKAHLDIRIGNLKMISKSECVELDIPYVNISMSTDYDCWKEEEESVTQEMVFKTMKENADKVTKLLINVIPKINE